MTFNLRSLPIAVLLAAAALGSAIAADLPKEGRYDFTACWAGISNTINFSKTHTAFSFEMTGNIRSNPPDGLFDKESFRCVGINYALDGKNGGTTVCEALAADGAKRLVFFSNTPDGGIHCRTRAGTGSATSAVDPEASRRDLARLPVPSEASPRALQRR